MVANTTINMVVILDGEAKIEWINPAFTRVTGYTIGRSAWKTSRRFLKKDPGLHLPFWKPYKKVLTQAKASRMLKWFIIPKVASLTGYRFRFSPFMIRLEKSFSSFPIETDITERKATQQALLDRNEELIKINSELDRFVYSASHDLRAPIASLLGLIEVARLETDLNAILQLLELQKKSLQRMDRFINDIVDHSRNLRLQVEPEEINFDRMIQTTFEQLQFMENVSRIRKVINIDQKGTFHTSATRVDIILNNLISNAIKYADLRKADPYLMVGGNL